MASITQTIPSFTGGISQQPDELVLPGQLKSLDNGIPDITDGLVKRPGSKFVSALSGAGVGTWFSYFRDAVEGAYIGQVQRDGAVKIWNTSGTLVHNGNANAYLAHTTDLDLKFLTVADTTFVTNSTVQVQRTSTKSPARNPVYQSFIELRQLAYGKHYAFSTATPSASVSTLDGAGRGRVTRATLKPVTYPTITRGTAGGGGSAYAGIDPSLLFQGSEVLGAVGGSGANMVVRLTVTGQVAVATQAVDVDADDYVGIYYPKIEILDGGRGYATTDSNVQVTMKGITYGIQIDEIQEIKGKFDLGYHDFKTTSFNPNTVLSAESILGQGGGTNAGINFERIGNGYHVTSANPFVVHTANPDLWKITTTEINDPTELPRQCKHGMVVKVLSSSDSVEDDYFLEFVGDNNGDGPGSWQETVAPDTFTTLDAATFPHIIQRQADGTFTVGTYTWTPRKVGDDETNPFPSFFSDVANNVGKKISQTFFHRNRLGFLCEDNIILSRASEPGNFFQDSALVIGSSDPIDIQASSTEPTLLKNAIETNTGLIIFAETQQFLLHTDSDTLTPDTGKVSNISTYRYNSATQPVSLGTTIGFMDTAGVNSRFFEMYDIRREGEPQIVEQNKIAPRLLPDNIELVTNSRENNTVFISRRGQRNIWGFRYFNNGETRVQSAWFRWMLPFDFVNMFVIGNKLYFVSSTYDLLYIPLRQFLESPNANQDDIWGSPGGFSYAGDSIHLDAHKTVSVASNAYDGTHTTITTTFAGTVSQLAAVNTNTGEVFMEDTALRNGNTYKFLGDFSGDSVVMGILFDFEATIPRIYVKKKSGEFTTSDVTASLTIQRLRFSFGPVGQIDINIKRVGKPDMNIQYESTPMDFYDADELPFVNEKIQNVPVYERNKNCLITLSSTHPGPAQLFSMTWEGDFTPMHHKRV